MQAVLAHPPLWKGAVFVDVYKRQSQSRPVNYCMQDGRGPDSIGRRQMRQHMRDVS